MKKIFIIGLLIVAISCAPDDEFSPPKITSENVELQTNVDLDAILGAFFQNPEKVVTFNQDFILEAYVISSDEAGNFYKELVVQDKPQNPTAGLNIKINLNSYFQFFNFGRKIYINLKGLGIAEQNGVATLGLIQGKEVNNIPQSMIASHFTRSSQVAEIIPLEVEPIQFNDRMENLYIRVKNVQFSRFLVDDDQIFTFASEDNDEFDGERLLESCSGGFPFILSTSTFADFKAFRLPKGSGYIDGILTRDFYDDFFTIYVNTPSEIHFTEERCDLPFTDCGIAATEGPKILFSDDFSLQKNLKPVTGNGWSNIVQEGSRSWEAYTATGANASLGKSVRVRPSGSGDQKTTAWLITPKISFDTNTGETLRFKTSTSFANGSLLEVLISTNWDGKEENLLKADWKLLPAAYIAQNSDYFGDWISSGLVDLSCITGKAHIAFRYNGSDLTYYNGIYELDDVVIAAD